MSSHGVLLEVVSEILGRSSIAITGDVWGTSHPTSRARRWTSSVPPSASGGGLMVVKKVVNALGKQSGAARLPSKRPLTCGVLLSG